MKATEQTRAQDIKPKTVNRTTFVLGILLTIFATAVIVTIANWFLYTDIQAQARADVHEDITLVSKGLGR
ncbi:hypothetical protein AR689_07535 [Arthrobacter sp. EpRS71]|nr:hypothetical protein AR689_07535 [Arthrobacter sp. EpRS71]